MWSHGGQTARSSQNYHTSMCYCRPMPVWLDCGQLNWKPSDLLRRLRILWRRYPEYFTSRLRQLDHRPHQDRDTDGNVLVLHLYCVLARSAVGRCSNSKRRGQVFIRTSFWRLITHVRLIAIGSCYY